MPQKSPSRSQDKFILRLPDGMRDEIKTAADKSGRSMNAEIVHRLQTSFTQPSIEQTDEYIVSVIDKLLDVKIEAAMKNRKPLMENKPK